jgi:NAD-dependent SIR2 family protein deacetylase
LLTVGTSGVVQPAASLVQQATASAVVIEINPAEGGHRQSGLHWKTTAGRGLPELVDFLIKHR